MVSRLRDCGYVFIALWSTTLTLSQAINASEFQIVDNSHPEARADGTLNSSSATRNSQGATASHSGYPGTYTLRVEGEAGKPDAYLSYVDVASLDAAASYTCGPSNTAGSGHTSQGTAHTVVDDVAATPATYIEATLTLHTRLNQTVAGGTLDGYASAKAGGYELRWWKGPFGLGPFGVTLHGAGLDQYGTVVKNGADTDAVVVVVFRNGGGTDLNADDYLSGTIAGDVMASSTVTVRPTNTMPTVITAHLNYPVYPVAQPIDWGGDTWPGIFIFTDDALDLSDTYWDYLPDSATNPPVDYTDLE